MKKLVYICNSLDRLKLLDRLNFTDPFNGEVYIVSDDRYLTTYQEIINYLNTECTNPVLKDAKFVSLKNEVIPFVLSKMSIPGYEEDFSKLLLIATLITPVYFCRSSEDVAFIVEDDVVLFKNPEKLMDNGLQCTSTNLYPATISPDKVIRDIFNIFSDNALEKLEVSLSEINLGEVLYKKFGKMLANANTVWTYIPELSDYFSKFMQLESVKKNIDINRRRGEKLYQYGFGVRLEFFTACILLNHDVKFYDNTQIITQGREHAITGAKFIADKSAISYHYTVINDDYVFQWLPFLVDNGLSEYKKKSKDYEYIKKNKFQYLTDDLTNNFSIGGRKKEKPVTCSVVRRKLF